MTILLVRHARAGRRDRWKGDDRLRPLSKKGRAQAGGMPSLLAPWTGDGRAVLVSSPWVRCIETLEPLAVSLGLPVRPDDVLGEGMGGKVIDSLGAWTRARKTTVLCTHGDVVLAVLDALAVGGVDIGPDPQMAKGSVWVLEGAGGAVRAATYLPPPT